MTFDLISTLIGAAIGGGLVYAVMRGRTRAGSDFSALAQDALNRNAEQFLILAQEKLRSAQAEGSHTLEKRQKDFNDLIEPIRKNLEQLGGSIEQIKGTDKALREDLLSLNRETAKLAGALRDPAGQGKWGEFILEGLLQKSGLLKGVHYETQTVLESDKGRQRPDAIINLQDGLKIVIDSKAPINEIALRADQSLSAQEAEEAAQALAQTVRKHIKDLGSKNYWENLESPDFTVLFLPSEYLFSQALRADPSLADTASQSNIIICSPTLLMSLLRVVSLGWRQAALAKNAQDISARGSELYQRLATFAGHFEKVGKGISAAMSGYNDAVGSLERMVLPSARKLKELHVQTGGKDVPEPAPVEILPRSLNLIEDDKAKKTGS